MFCLNWSATELIEIGKAVQLVASSQFCVITTVSFYTGFTRNDKLLVDKNYMLVQI